jgi:ribonuclease E
MNRILLLPITVPLRVAALQLRLARGAVGMALDVTRDLAGGSPVGHDAGGAAAAPPTPMTPAAPRRAGPDPAEPAREARRRAAVQRTRARPEPAAPRPATDIPPAPEQAPRPRPRRAARKATAAKPARERTGGSTRARAAAVREARREAEAAAAVASAGPATGAGPEIHVEAPWAGYDEMALDEVLARLADADATLLAAVRLYEGQRESRQAILLATET